MSIEKITVLNLETGDVGEIRRDWYENPIINNGLLEEVDPGTKPYVADLFKSRVPADGDEDDTAPSEEGETPEEEEI